MKTFEKSKTFHLTFNTTKTKSFKNTMSEYKKY